MNRLCKGCGDRSKPLNPSAVSDYHPACHPAKNKTGPKPPRAGGYASLKPGDFFSKIREGDAIAKGLIEGGRIITGEPVMIKVDIAKQETITPTGHRGPKPMNTSVRDLLKGSEGMLEKRAAVLEKRAARIGAKIAREDAKLEPLRQVYKDLKEAAQKLRTIMNADD